MTANTIKLLLKYSSNATYSAIRLACRIEPRLKSILRLPAHSDHKLETPLINSRFLKQGNQPGIVLNWDYEFWFQRGAACRAYALPRPMVKEVFFRSARQRSSKGYKLKPWQVRAFIYGWKYCESERRTREGREWPTPPEGWNVVFIWYPSTGLEVDFRHPVSHHLWSEHNGKLSMPQLRDRDTIPLSVIEETLGLRVYRPSKAANQSSLPRQKGRHLKVV